MLLRAARNLSNGIKRGEMFPSSRLAPKTAQMLMGKGLITPATAPPIGVVSALEGISGVLESAGVATLEDLIEAEAVDGLTAEELAGWQTVAAGVMNVGKPCGCGRK